MSPSLRAQSAETKMLPDNSGAQCVEFGEMVLGKLDSLVRKGMAALPKRGLEVGGILLGKAPTRESSIVRIDDIRPIAIEHQYGPSFRLSGRDRQAFAEVLQEARGDGLLPLGHFRSHTRGELQVTEDDLLLVNSLPGSAFRWMLLIRGAAFEPCSACLYGRDRPNRWTSLVSFQFPAQHSVPPAQTIDASKASRTDNPPAILTVRRAPSALREPKRILAAVTGKAERQGPPVPSSFRTGLDRTLAAVAPPFHVALAIAACIIVLLAAAAAFDGFSNPAPAAVSSPRPTLGLRVQLLPGALAVDWDRGLGVVQNSASAFLEIRDGPSLRRIPLTPLETRAGSFLYRPSSRDVSLRLEVTAGGGSPLTEAVRFLDASETPRVAEFRQDAAVDAVSAKPAPSAAKSRSRKRTRSRR